MSWLGGNGDTASRRTGVVTVLDVGSSKVCCIVARLKPAEPSQLLRGRTHKAQVIGIGHQKSHGVKSGVVVELDRAEQAIRLAVDAAERMAGLTVDFADRQCQRRAAEEREFFGDHQSGRS